MVSTIIQGNFTTNARLVREQRRAQSKETLMGIIDNASLNEEQKQAAVETLVNLTTIAEKENAAELLLEAKGFADPIVNISENEVDVVINATSVTDQQIAQIEDIVTRKTGYEVEDITITAAIQED
jgi:stage III sporulation protein AH